MSRQAKEGDLPAFQSQREAISYEQGACRREPKFVQTSYPVGPPESADTETAHRIAWGRNKHKDNRTSILSGLEYIRVCLCIWICVCHVCISHTIRYTQSRATYM